MGKPNRCYMVYMTPTVCVYIGCWDEARYSVWDGKTHVGDYCHTHGLDTVKRRNER